VERQYLMEEATLLYGKEGAKMFLDRWLLFEEVAK
jgi:hypothetical protein